MSDIKEVSLPDFKVNFIEKSMEKGALLFGDFTLKSGRISPYFYNAGLLYNGSLIAQAATAFASSLVASDFPEFDVLLGPAYKGISLAAVTVLKLWDEHHVDKNYAYNRKEAKDHGEGGNMVGAPLKGRIVIIDDVITSGKAVREAIDIVSANPDAQLVGIVQLVDRQERGQKTSLSSVQEVEKEFGVPVVPLINMSDIMAYIATKPEMKEDLEKMVKYRAEYGVTA